MSETTINRRYFLLLLLVGATIVNGRSAHGQGRGDYDGLLELFAEWREFESPPSLEGAPDYTAETFAARYEAFKGLRDRLYDFDIDAWPIPQQVDWHLVRAEMNGFDFNHRVLKPWVRDPAFYQSIWMPDGRSILTGSNDGDSVSMWISDSEGRFGLPRFTIEAAGGEWDNRGVEANVAFPDGRVLIGSGGYAPTAAKVVGGKTVTLNAGPLTFELIERLRAQRIKTQLIVTVSIQISAPT